MIQLFLPTFEFLLVAVILPLVEAFVSFLVLLLLLLVKLLLKLNIGNTTSTALVNQVGVLPNHPLLVSLMANTVHPSCALVDHLLVLLPHC